MAGKMNLNEYLMNQDCSFHRPYSVAKRIECEDGFSLSVQASQYAYCSPRTNVGPWKEVEVGFPSGVPTEIMQYAEDQNNPTGTVYSCVPVELVEELIESHGGMKAN